MEISWLSLDTMKLCWVIRGGFMGLWVFEKKKEFLDHFVAVKVIKIW
jgi:hypothetical protein